MLNSSKECTVETSDEILTDDGIHQTLVGMRVVNPDWIVVVTGADPRVREI